MAEDEEDGTRGGGKVEIINYVPSENRFNKSIGSGVRLDRFESKNEVKISVP
jgi:hypothetical protein